MGFHPSLSGTAPCVASLSLRKQFLWGPGEVPGLEQKGCGAEIHPARSRRDLVHFLGFGYFESPLLSQDKNQLEEEDSTLCPVVDFYKKCPLKR